MSDAMEDLRDLHHKLFRELRHDDASVIHEALREMKNLRTAQVGVNVGVAVRPISTAPKFLGQILLYGNLKGSPEKAWHIGEWFRCGRYGDGWWASPSVEVEATLWAPLPDAPPDVGVNVGVSAP